MAFDVNVGGTFNVLEAADSLDVDRVVVASSATVYGDVPDDVVRINETVTRWPNTVYGLTKFNVEEIGALYQRHRDIEFAAIEPVHGLGPNRCRGNLQDVSVLKAAVADEPLTVPARTSPFEIVYVEDERGRSLSRRLPANYPTIGTSSERATE